MKHIVVVGATSAIAEHCMRLWQAHTPIRFELVGRNKEALTHLAQDLSNLQPRTVCHIHTLDFLDPAAIAKLADQITQNGVMDLVFIAQGWLGSQDTCQHDLSYCKNMLEINAISPLLFAEAFAAQMEKVNKGHLALVGSIAGERGRQSIYVYGAAKACMAHYVQGLQHRFANTAVSVSLIEPGPTKTPMTSHLTRPLAPVTQVAKTIVKGLAAKQRVIYAPVKWRLIMWVARNLPTRLWEQIKF